MGVKNSIPSKKNSIPSKKNSIQQLFNFNKKPFVIKGGVLEDSDFEKINELITHQLVHFKLIPAIDTEVKQSSIIAPVIDAAAINTEVKQSSIIEPIIDAAAIEAAMANSIKVNNTGNIPNAVFAKSTIPLAQKISRSEIFRLKQQNKDLPLLGSSDVYFHMVKITEENVIKWKQFEAKIKEISPDTLININSTGTMLMPIDSDSAELRSINDRIIYIPAGLNYFKIRESNTSSDLFVVYASKTLHKTNSPPDWKDVEIMVTVLARENVPFVTQMGIVKLAHTYTKGAFEGLARLNKELFDYLELIDFNYPSHSHISLYLFTFIGTYIYQFFSTKKTALFTSPTESISSIIINTLKKYKLPYGYERRRHVRGSDSSIIKLNLSNDSQPFLNLSRDNLKELCPWYCNIFLTVRDEQTVFPDDEGYDTKDDYNNYNYTYPENTEDCYQGPPTTSAFLYVPIYTFTQLVERGIYQFEPIE